MRVERIIHRLTRAAKEKYRQARSIERNLFKEKSRQLDEETLIDLRDDGVEIELPSREEIESSQKYLKNNKAVGSDSIAAELLKNSGPQLVDALEEVIQLAWTSQTLHESWIKEVLCPVYKKGDKLDCTSYRGICLLNVAYKVFAKVLYDRLLP
jgi:hypothetical protein